MIKSSYMPPVKSTDFTNLITVLSEILEKPYTIARVTSNESRLVVNKVLWFTHVPLNAPEGTYICRFLGARPGGFTFAVSMIRQLAEAIRNAKVSEVEKELQEIATGIINTCSEYDLSKAFYRIKEPSRELHEYLVNMGYTEFHILGDTLTYQRGGNGN